MRPNVEKYPSQDDLREVFEYREDGNLYWKVARGKATIGKMAGSMMNGYVDIFYRGTHLLAHRLVWIYHNGDLLPDTYIDHRNGDRADNRIENLRVVSRSINAMNKTPERTADYRHLPVGVYPNWGKNGAVKSYQARFKQQYLGSFKTADEAAAAYQDAKKSHMMAELSGAYAS